MKKFLQSIGSSFYTALNYFCVNSSLVFSFCKDTAQCFCFQGFYELLRRMWSSFKPDFFIAENIHRIILGFSFYKLGFHSLKSLLGLNIKLLQVILRTNYLNKTSYNFHLTGNNRKTILFCL